MVNNIEPHVVGTVLLAAVIIAAEWRHQKRVRNARRLVRTRKA
mgnify:CR=1 FL=1